MTEHEFDQQIWRNYDRVTIQLSPDQAPWKQKVNSVCFPTHSVQVNMPNGGREWVRCECIVTHTCATGATDDLQLIEDLHNKLMAANKRNEELQIIKMQLESKLSSTTIADLRKSINVINNNLSSKKATIERIDEAVKKIEKAIDKMESNSNEE